MEALPERVDVAIAETIAQTMGRRHPSARINLSDNLRHVLTTPDGAVADAVDADLDLLAHDADPSTLGWLARTGARFGLLGVWRGVMAGTNRGEGTSPGLEVVGSFQASGEVLELASTSYDAELFPPAELFEAAGPECFVSIFPVRSAGTGRAPRTSRVLPALARP